MYNYLSPSAYQLKDMGEVSRVVVVFVVVVVVVVA